jgi:hypothetical protein
MPELILIFPSVCVSVCVSLLLLQDNGSVNLIPPFGAKQRLDKHVSAAANRRKNSRIVEPVIFFEVRVLSEETMGGLSLYPLIVTKQKLGKDVSATTKNCFRYRFLCGP